MIRALRDAGLRPGIWIPVICVLLTATLAWAGWNTNATHNALPETKFEAHEQLNIEQQQRIEDKIDDLKDTIIDIIKGD